MARSAAAIHRATPEAASEALRFLALGLPGVEVARRSGLDPRDVSVLRATLSSPAPGATQDSPSPGQGPSIEAYRRLLDRSLPMSKRVKLATKAVDVALKTGNPQALAAGMRAVERADEVTGLVSRKGEGVGARTAPLFTMPTCACQAPRLVSKAEAEVAGKLETLQGLP